MNNDVHTTNKRSGTPCDPAVNFDAELQALKTRQRTTDIQENLHHNKNSAYRELT